MDFLSSYEFDVDSQIDKLETIAYGIEKNESILCSFRKSLLDTVSMYLLFDISSAQSRSIYLFLSFSYYLSHSLSLSLSLLCRSYPNIS